MRQAERRVTELSAQLPLDIRGAIATFDETSFDCGAWTDGDDETYEEVYLRHLRVETTLYEALLRALK